MAVATRDTAAERADIDRAVEGKTICSVFAATAAEHAEAEALKWRDADGWRALTWREYRDEVERATLGLLEHGFGAGQFGLILARNVPRHVVADLAIVHARGASVSVYNTLAPAQIAYIANHCSAAVVFVENADFLPRIEAIRDQVPSLRTVVLLEGEAPGCVSWDELLAAGAAARERDPGAFERAWRAVAPGDLANLIYTSGTTGPPKGVMYSHYNVVWTCESSQRMTSNVRAGMRFISYLPLAHIAERFSSHYYGSLYVGGVVHYVPDLQALPQALVEVRPQFFVGVPRLWEKFHAAVLAGISADPDAARREAITKAIEAGRQLVAYDQRGEAPPPPLEAARERIAPVQAALRAKLGLDQCEIAVTSTAPMPVEVLEFYAAIGLPLLEVWGMSELTGPATGTPQGAIRIGTVGIAYPGVEVKLGDDGEVLARGGNLMQGYYRDPEKTAEAIDADGWMHTGDVGRFDDDGNLRIIDRKKELIVTSYGKNISPANIESLLLQHPLIGFACVIGDRRPYVSALLVLDSQSAPAWAKAHGVEFSSPAELASHPEVLAEVGRVVDEVNEHLSRVEQVKRFRVLPAEWSAESEELTPTLKLKRRVVHEKYAGEIEEMYSGS